MSSPQIISNADWAHAVERCLGIKQFQVLNYNLQPLGSTGGFLGDHYTAEVTVRLHQTKNQKTLHFFLKTEPRSVNDSKLTKQINVFKKEVDTLNILFPKFQSVLKEGGKNMVWMCQCYYTQPEFIILEDLSKQGFCSFTQRDTLRYEHFELTMKALANMHAASVIFEETRPKQHYRLIDEFPDVFEEALFRHAPNHPGTRWLNTAIKTMWLLVELIHGKDALTREMKSSLEQIMLSLYDLQKPSERFRNVLCQGDVKRENFMFRHESGVPVEVRIVDYQFTRYAPPANDVMCFLYLSSYKKFRDHHFTGLLTVYYDQFSRNLTDHGLDPEKLISWQQFKESCDFYRIVGILIASCYCPGTYSRPEDIKHVFTSSEIERYIYDDRDKEVSYSFNNDDFYKENVVDVVNELMDYARKSNQKSNS